jgi:hypothetical protein
LTGIRPGAGIPVVADGAIRFWRIGAVAGVADAVVVGVRLVKIGEERTVVVAVEDPIVVIVIVAGVAQRIAIGVGL